MQKSTTQLLRELKSSGCSLPKYLDDNESAFVINDNARRFWQKLVLSSEHSKSNIINKADISHCYFYEVINGRKLPSKDKVIRLVLAMGLDLNTCQQALKISGKSALYPKIRRDSIIIYAIQKKLSVSQCNELLASYGEGDLK